MPVNFSEKHILAGAEGLRYHGAQLVLAEVPLLLKFWGVIMPVNFSEKHILADAEGLRYHIAQLDLTRVASVDEVLRAVRSFEESQ